MCVNSQGKNMSHTVNELENSCVKMKTLWKATGMKCFLLRCLALLLKQVLQNIICKNDESWIIPFYQPDLSWVYLNKSHV